MIVDLYIRHAKDSLTHLRSLSNAVPDGCDCRWTLIPLLFFSGVMNPGWIAGLAILVLAEKIAHRSLDWTRHEHLHGRLEHCGDIACLLG